MRRKVIVPRWIVIFSFRAWIDRGAGMFSI